MYLRLGKCSAIEYRFPLFSSRPPSCRTASRGKLCRILLKRGLMRCQPLVLGLLVQMVTRLGGFTSSRRCQREVLTSPCLSQFRPFGKLKLVSVLVNRSCNTWHLSSKFSLARGSRVPASSTNSFLKHVAVGTEMD